MILSERNYNLARLDQPQKQIDFLHARLGEIKVHNRKDVNVMVAWIVTAPKDLPVDEQEQFFKKTYDFLNERYGKDNVISAYVHMDETTPHIHYSFVPVVEDSKRGGYKLSAKEAITRSDLRSFHGDLQNYLEKELGHAVGVLDGATKEGNQSIVKLKRGTAIKKLNEQVKRFEEMKEVSFLKPKEIKPVDPKRGLFGGDKVDYEEYKEVVNNYNKVMKGYIDRENEIRSTRFKNNALNNGLLPVVIPEKQLTNLLGLLKKEPDTQVQIDLPQQIFTVPSKGLSLPFEINRYKKECLMKGLDDIDYLLGIQGQITDFEIKTGSNESQNN